MLQAYANLELVDEETPASTDHILIDDRVGAESIALEITRSIRQKRRYSRYVRDDIRCDISQREFLFRREYRRVRLIDISQRGLSIGCAKKLKCGQRAFLRLTFQDGQSFDFSGVIVNRRAGDEDMTYGIRFEKANRQFEEHLLKTGLKIKLQNASIRG